MLTSESDRELEVFVGLSSINCSKGSPLDHTQFYSTSLGHSSVFYGMKLKRSKSTTVISNNYGESIKALKQRFNPDSKKELYVAKLHTQVRHKGEDWASY